MMRYGRKAFTIVEMLIALAIMAALMAALAVGVHASLQNFQENDQLAQVTQVSRAVLDRIATDVRTAKTLTTTSSGITITPPDNDDGLSQIRYYFAGGTLTYEQTVNGKVNVYPLVAPGETVTPQSFAVSSRLGKNAQNQDCIVNLTVSLTLRCENKTYPYSISVAPRRNLVY